MKLCFRPPLYILFSSNCAEQAQGTMRYKLVIKHVPKWVQTRDPVISSPARHLGYGLLRLRILYPCRSHDLFMI